MFQEYLKKMEYYFFHRRRAYEFSGQISPQNQFDNSLQFLDQKNWVYWGDFEDFNFEEYPTGRWYFSYFKYQINEFGERIIIIPTFQIWDEETQSLVDFHLEEESLIQAQYFIKDGD